MLTVRSATELDVPFIVELGSQLYDRSRLIERGFEFDPLAARASAFQWLGCPQVFGLLVAEVAGIRVGAIGFALAPVYFGGAINATSCFWGQTNEARGIGVARALLTAAEQWARERGASHLTFLVLPNREQNKVIGALRRRGFEQTETAWTRRL